jgi:hypothetical protein
MNSIRAGFALVALSILTSASANAAILTGDVASPPANVNLTTQGNTDWIHWGLNAANDVTRKATGLSQISNFTKIGSGTNVVRLTDSPSKYSWTDGMPNVSTTNTPGGVYINNYDGPGRGFQFTVPAEVIEHTLFVHLGEFNASGTLTASLNDGSGKTYSQTMNGIAGQTKQGVYTIDFQANSPGSLLTVKWVETTDMGASDNITLQAVALCTPPQVPEPSVLGLLLAGASVLAYRRKH